MSWWVINIVIFVQVYIIYLVMVNTANMRAVMSNIGEWIYPWPSEADDIKFKLKELLDVIGFHLFKIADNIKYVVVCIALTVIANMDNNPIVYIPFWAGIGFALEHLLFYVKIETMGELLNIATNEAEQSFFELISEQLDHPQGEGKDENICG